MATIGMIAVVCVAVLCVAVFAGMVLADVFYGRIVERFTGDDDE